MHLAQDRVQKQVLVDMVILFDDVDSSTFTKKGTKAKLLEKVNAAMNISNRGYYKYWKSIAYPSKTDP
jgi:hypothetical protein